MRLPIGGGNRRIYYSKKVGANFKGLSPFTQERTPSFMVSPAKQIWKDFSSGKGAMSSLFDGA